MKYNLVSKRKLKRPNRPFIVPFMYYIFGVGILVLTIWIKIKVFQADTYEDDGILGIIAYTLAMLFLAGIGIISVIVGYKRRKY